MIGDFCTGCIKFGGMHPLFDPIDLGIGAFELGSAIFGAGAEAVGAGAAAVGEGAAAIGEGVGAGLGAVGDVATGAVGAVGDVASGAANALGSAASGIGDTISSGVTSATNALGLGTPTDTALATGVAPSAPSSAPTGFGFQGSGASLENLGTSSFGTDQALSTGSNLGIGAPTTDPGLATVQQAAQQGDLGFGDPATVTTTSTGSDLTGSFQPTSDVLPSSGSSNLSTEGFFSDPTTRAAASNFDSPIATDPGATATPTSTVASSNTGSLVDNALKYGKLASGALGLGSLAYTALEGNKLPKQSAKAEAIALNEKGLGQEFLGDVKANQITPQMQAAVDQYKNFAKAQLYQQFAQNGADPTKNTAYIQQAALIDQNAAIMYEKFVDQLFNEGLAASGAASSTLQNIAKMKMQQDQQLAMALGKAASATGAMMGSGTTIRIG